MRLVVSAISENKFLIRYLPLFRTRLQYLNNELESIQLPNLSSQKVDVVIMDQPHEFHRESIRDGVCEVTVGFRASVFGRRVGHASVFPYVSDRVAFAISGVQCFDRQTHHLVERKVASWRDQFITGATFPIDAL